MTDEDSNKDEDIKLPYLQPYRDLTHIDNIQNGHLIYIFLKKAGNYNKTSHFLSRNYPDLLKLKALETLISRKMKTFFNLKRRCGQNKQMIVLEHFLAVKTSMPKKANDKNVEGHANMALKRVLDAQCIEALYAKKNNKKRCTRCPLRLENLKQSERKRKEGLAKVKKAATTLMEIKRLQRELDRWSTKEKKQKMFLNKSRYLKKKIKMQLTYSNEKRKLKQPQLQTPCLKCFKKDNKIADLNKRVLELEMEIEDFKKTEKTQETQRFQERQVSTKMDKKTYDVPIRKCIYTAIDLHNPLNAIGPQIRYFCKTLLNTEMKNIPCEGHISKMAYELTSLSNMQVGEAMLANCSLTICWDGGSEPGEHYFEIHISLSPTHQLTLGVTRLPGGTADDYAKDINRALSSVATSTATSKHLMVGPKLDAVQIKAKLVASISNSLADRAAVCKSLHRKLEIEWNRELLELHCNLHPLEGLARAAKTALKAYDGQISSTTFGNDGRAANLIYAISKLR